MNIILMMRIREKSRVIYNVYSQSQCEWLAFRFKMVSQTYYIMTIILKLHDNNNNNNNNKLGKGSIQGLKLDI